MSFLLISSENPTQSAFHDLQTRSRIFLSTGLQEALKRARRRVGQNRMRIPPFRESDRSRYHVFHFVNKQGTCSCTLADVPLITYLFS